MLKNIFITTSALFMFQSAFAEIAQQGAKKFDCISTKDSMSFSGDFSWDEWDEIDGGLIPFHPLNKAEFKIGENSYPVKRSSHELYYSQVNSNSDFYLFNYIIAKDANSMKLEIIYFNQPSEEPTSRINMTCTVSDLL